MELVNEISQKVTNVFDNVNKMKAHEEALKAKDKALDELTPERRKEIMDQLEADRAKNPGNYKNGSMDDYVNEYAKNEAYQKQYNDSMSKSDTALGGDLRQAIGSVTSLVQGIISGNIGGGLANASAPHLAEVIKNNTQSIDKNGNFETDKVSNTIAHTILGALVASLNGQSALAGGLGAGTGELAADIIRDKLYGGKSNSELSPQEKDEINALAALVAGLTGALTGDGSVADTATAVGGSKNAVENNFLGPQDQDRLMELRKKRDEGFLTQSEKIEMFMMDELDQKGDYLVGKYIRDPNSLTEAEAQRLAVSLSRYYQQEEGMSGEQAARQSVHDLITGVWGYRANNYDYPYLSYDEHKERFIDDYWESVSNKSFIEKLFTTREKDVNEEYYREQYAIQKYLQSTEWERQVGRPVMNFLPGGIGFVYNVTDTLQGSHSLGQGIGQLYRDGEFKTDTVLKLVDGVLTLAPAVTSNLIPKGNTNSLVGYDPVIPNSGLTQGPNAIGSANSGYPGSITFEKGATPNANEIRAANAFLGLGYDVTIKKEVNQHKVKTQGFWIEGIGKVDVYTPKVRDISKILTAIEKKNNQTNSVLTQVDLSVKDMQQIANRTWGKPSAKNIHTLFFQDSKGQVYRYNRPNNGAK